MTINQNRKEYWNESYVKYWQSRVQEAGLGKSKVIEGDPNTEDDNIYSEIFSKTPFKRGKLLDVGCAWGRMFPLYIQNEMIIDGVDISSAMIQEARKLWKAEDQVASIQESEAEKIPFKDSHFENLCCLAVFDATYQDQAMSEFIRVTKPGGLIYLTGKNTNYHSDDEEAYAAEVGARAKGHPNFFTNVEKLIRDLEQDGHIIVANYYFPRRGDFAKFNFEDKFYDKFYEFFLVIEVSNKQTIFNNLSEKYSKTFKESTGDQKEQ
ncbi:MAG: class I SAM-dependent methyltransferase [Candidatus Cloacimonetes bacterium]|nr:class I SAM-dependent methyltransferase [Candidatus Cloacimonadota bacterium]